MGNICRSPAAEAVFRAFVRQEGFADQIECDSAGTLRDHAGEKPDRRMTRAAAERDIELTGRARQIVVEDFDRFDRIVVMDRQNLARVRELAPTDEARERVLMMADFHPEDDVREVPDPYFGGPEGFDLVLDILEVSCRRLLKDTISAFELVRR